MAATSGTWLHALAEARAGLRAANVVWFGDSISELDEEGEPFPWIVGRVLSGWTESVQYRNAGAAFTPTAMVTTGQPSPEEVAGFGGRSVELAPGDHSTLSACGQGVTVLWSRQPGGGMLEVTWGGDRLGSIDTDGPAAASQQTTFAGSHDSIEEALTITARDRSARLEGVYLHRRNLDRGLRIWPAVQAGNTTGDFLTHPSWGLDSLAGFDPDLVVIATGTNKASQYLQDLDALIDSVRDRTGCDIAVWVPYLTPMIDVERAAAARSLAESRGCLVIDAASALGTPATVDDIHPTAATIAVAAAHAATVLSGDPVGTAAQIAGQAASSSRSGQVWQSAGGSIAIESLLGSKVLAGRTGPTDPGQQWALLLANMAAGLLGLPGPSISFGPGGDAPIDTHLSRAGSGHFSLNAGAGQLDLARLRITESAAPDADGRSAVLYSRSRAGVTELAAVLPDGSHHAIAPAPVGGYRAPVPCTLAPSHQRADQGIELPQGRVHWVPLPTLAAGALATDVWVDVVVPAAGATAAAAIVITGLDGRPAQVVAQTGPAAIDLGQSGFRGAALDGAIEVAPGEGWWVAVMVDAGSGRASVAGTHRIEGPAIAQLGATPVRPGAGATGVLVLDGQVTVPDRPGPDLIHATGAVPVAWVTLQAP